MPQFLDTDMGVGRMTPEQLDAVALAGGDLGSIGYGFACNGTTPAPKAGYSFLWIDRRGMGNHGRLIMRGENARTRALLRQGRKAKLMTNFAIDESTADRLMQATARYTRECGVIGAALAARNMNWTGYPGCGGGVGTWLGRHSDIAEACAGLSVPRIDAVYALVVELQRP